MTKFQSVTVLIIWVNCLTGCFVDSRITGLVSTRIEGDGANSEIQIEVKSPPSSIAFLDSGAFEMSVTEIANLGVSDFQATANESCQVTTTGCGPAISPGGNCSIQLQFDADNLESVQCRVRFAYVSQGKAITKDVSVQSPVTVPGVSAVQKVYPVNGANWNDYILNNNSSQNIWNQSDSACTLAGMPGSVSRNYCIHGAEHLKVATGLDSCSDLSLVETLGVFKWKCVVDSGKAYFFSYDLKEGKGLRNLISTTGWIDNSVSVYKNATLIVQSPMAKWWSNVIQALPANPSTPGLSLPASLDGTGIIYYLSSDQTSRAYRPAAKTAIVSLNSAKLKPLDATATENTCVNFFGNRSCLLDLTNAVMTWLETEIEYTATSAPYWAVYLKTAHFARIVNTTIAGRPSSISDAGIYADDADFIRANNLTVSSFVTCLSWYSFSQYSTLENIMLKGCTFGLDLNSFNYSALLRRIYVMNGARGLVINTSSGNAVIQGLSSFNIANGNTISGGSTSPVYVNSMFSVNSGASSSNSDLAIGAGLVATLTNVAITNSVHAITLGSSVSAKFTGALVLGTNGTNCAVAGSNSGLINTTCADAYADGASSYGTSSSNAVLRIGRTAAASFVGKVITNDVKSTIDTNGLAAITSLVPSAVFNLDTIFRGWGIESTNMLDNTSAQGRCTSGNCRIYDWSLKPTDTVFRNSSGDGASQNEPFVAGSACPAAVHGNKITVSNGSTPVTYLNNGWEVLFDNIGDEDGFCESNEDCMYVPNFGAYQNELDGGVLSSSSCVFQNGVLSNIKIYGYE